jgi:hypothetical protein
MWTGYIYIYIYVHIIFPTLFFEPRSTGYIYICIYVYNMHRSPSSKWLHHPFEW